MSDWGKKFQIPPKRVMSEADEYICERANHHVNRPSLKSNRSRGVGEQRGGQLKGEKARIFLDMYDALYELYGTHAETMKAIGYDGAGSARNLFKERGYLSVQMGEKILAEWKRTKKERARLKNNNEEKQL